MPAARFEPAIPASDRPQTHALDGAATEARQRIALGVVASSAVDEQTQN